MYALAKLVFLFAAVLSVAAMPSHIARNSHNHREIAARAPKPEAAPAVQIVARDMPVPVRRANRRKRAGNGRCEPVTTTSNQPDQDQTPPTTNQPAPESTPDSEPTPDTPAPDPEPSPVTTKPDPKPSTTNKPPPSPTPDPDTGGGETHNGQGTFYATGLGACGITNNDGQDIAAVSHLFFDSFPGYNGANPNNNPLCNKTARVTYKGKTINVKLTDRCQGCAFGDLDFSPHAFNQLADPAEGRISGLSWVIID